MEEITKLMEEKIEKARQIGIQIGILQGIEEGEFRQRMNIAYTMVQAGESREKILAYTQATKEDVEEYME